MIFKDQYSEICIWTKYSNIWVIFGFQKYHESSSSVVVSNDLQYASPKIYPP